MEEIVERAKRIYAEQIESKTKPEDDGKIVAIEVESGDYEIAAHESHLDAVLRLRARHENPQVFSLRVGGGPVVRLGASSLYARKRA